MTQGWRWQTRFHTWEEAMEWIKGGRKKTHRPLYHKGLSLRISQPDDPDSTIQLGWQRYYTDEHSESQKSNATLLVIGKNNLAVAPGSGWLWGWGSRDALTMYANLVSMYQQNYKLRIRQHTDVLIKGTAKPCPSCRGMKSWISRDEFGAITEDICRRCYGEGFLTTSNSYKPMTWPYVEQPQQYGRPLKVLVPILIDLVKGEVKGMLSEAIDAKPEEVKYAIRDLRQDNGNNDWSV